MGREDNNRGRGGGPRRFNKGFRNRKDSRDDQGSKRGGKNDRKRGDNRRGANKHRHQKKKMPDEIELNRQLKDYWTHLKDPTKTDEEKRQITSKKFNDEMDDYWKKQVKDEPAPPAS